MWYEGSFVSEKDNNSLIIKRTDLGFIFVAVYYDSRNVNSPVHHWQWITMKNRADGTEKCHS